MHLLRASQLIFAAVVLWMAGCTEQEDIRTERYPLSIGDTTVDLVVHRSSGAGLSYINLHDNENTAVDATLAILREHGGTLYELTHTGQRNIAFQLNDSSFAVDPNRIFTDRGIEMTLARQGRVSPSAREAVKSFADALLHRLDFDASSLSVTVHNKSDADYSVLSYADGGDLAAEARFVHVGVDGEPDDFYFVTSQVLYDELRGTGSNVVMQDNHRAANDGSLSILAAREGIPYVNVEAQHGHRKEQKAMLGRLHRTIVEGRRKVK